MRAFTLKEKLLLFYEKRVKNFFRALWRHKISAIIGALVLGLFQNTLYDFLLKDYIEVITAKVKYKDVKDHSNERKVYISDSHTAITSNSAQTANSVTSVPVHPPKMMTGRSDKPSTGKNAIFDKNINVAEAVVVAPERGIQQGSRNQKQSKSDNDGAKINRLVADHSKSDTKSAADNKDAVADKQRGVDGNKQVKEEVIPPISKKPWVQSRNVSRVQAEGKPGLSVPSVPGIPTVFVNQTPFHKKPPSSPAQKTSPANATAQVPVRVPKEEGAVDLPQPRKGGTLAEKEVTVSDFAKYLNETKNLSGCEVSEREWPIEKEGNDHFIPKYNKDDDPIRFVSFEAAQAYCDWLSRKEGKTYYLPDPKTWHQAWQMNGPAKPEKMDKSLLEICSDGCAYSCDEMLKDRDARGKGHWLTGFRVCWQ